MRLRCQVSGRKHCNDHVLSCACNALKFLPSTGKYSIISKLSKFLMACCETLFWDWPCNIKAVSFSEKMGPSLTSLTTSLLTGHAFWQYRHPTRQLCHPGDIHWGNSPLRSLWKVRHRSPWSKKRSGVIALVGQAFIQALQFSQRSSTCGSCQWSSIPRKSEINAASRW